MRSLHYALRTLRSTPLVSAAVILSLALGIGAATAIFSIANGLLLKPLPVRDPGSLVALVGDQVHEEGVAVSYPVWTRLRDRRLLPDAFAWAPDLVSLADTGEKQSAKAVWVSERFFATLAIGMQVGRAFVRATGSTPPTEAVISDAFWQRRFGRSAAALGQALTIGQVPFTIVGVAARDFKGLDAANSFDLILPLEAEPLLGRPEQRLQLAQWPWIYVMGRLLPGQTAGALAAAVRAAKPAIRQETMPVFTREEDRAEYLREPWSVQPAPAGLSELRTRYRPALLVLLGLVAVVLVASCANIATLLLARAARRRHEFGVRRALGASRSRLMTQLLTESAVLAVLGALPGVLFASWASRLVVRQLSTWAYTVSVDLSPDWRVAAAVAAITAVAAVLCGIAPAISTTRVPAIDLLLRAAGTSRRRVGAGASLVATQVALSVVLVVVGGLFVRSFVALAYRDLGLDRNRVLVAAIEANRSSVPPAGRLDLFARVRDQVAALPGVEGAAVSMATPIANAGIRVTPNITVPGSDLPADGRRIIGNPVSPGWFRVFGTRLIAGRDFDDRDNDAGEAVAIVNRSFARRYFHRDSVVGETIVEVIDSGVPGDTGRRRRPLRIIGVVEDAAFTSVRDPLAPLIYTSLTQRAQTGLLAAFPAISLSVRTRNGAALAPQIVDAITRVDPALGVTLQSLSQQLDVYYVRERLLALLAAFFSGFTLFLASLGLYATTAYSVNTRRRDIAVRIAVGADPRRVVRMVVGQAAAIAAAGIVAGSIVAFWAARLVSALLFQVRARDPVTFAGAAVTLVAATLIAAWLPGRRAARIDPADALRIG